MKYAMAVYVKKRALIEMTGLLKWGKIIELMLIFPHSNKPLEKPFFECLAFPHSNKVSYFYIYALYSKL
jgi:hypothetical protein